MSTGLWRLGADWVRNLQKMAFSQKALSISQHWSYFVLWVVVMWQNCLTMWHSRRRHGNDYIEWLPQALSSCWCLVWNFSKITFQAGHLKLIRCVEFCGWHKFWTYNVNYKWHYFIVMEGGGWLAGFLKSLFLIFSKKDLLKKFVQEEKVCFTLPVVLHMNILFIWSINYAMEN